MLVPAAKPAEVVRARFEELLGHQGFQNLQWPLPNMVEVTEATFWSWRASYTFNGEANFGQCKIADVDPHPGNRSGHPHWANIILYLVDHSRFAGGGFAVMYTYNWQDWKTQGPKDPAFPVVRYFEWRVCDHKFEETGPVERRSRGWHVYTCKDCGYSYTVDSGD